MTEKTANAQAHPHPINHNEVIFLVIFKAKSNDTFVNEGIVPTLLADEAKFTPAVEIIPKSRPEIIHLTAAFKCTVVVVRFFFMPVTTTVTKSGPVNPQPT